MMFYTNTMLTIMLCIGKWIYVNLFKLYILRSRQNLKI